MSMAICEENVAEKDISALIRIEGGIADEGKIDIYDAAGFINGLARSINIVTHAFANDEHIRKQAQAAHGSHSFLHSSIKGCFEERIDVVFDAKTVVKIGHSVIANNFWDYLTWCWAIAAGQEYDPTTSFVKKIKQKDEDFVFEMGDALETAMQGLHKSIARDRSMVMYLSRPRVGDVLKLDATSLDYVTTREEQVETGYILGNVTRYSVISDLGRLYSDNDNRIISFRFADSEESRLKGLAIDSMRSKVDGEAGKLHFKVSKVVSAQGVVKRYIVHDILKAT
ncbi:hypothetical protein CLU90_4004 [Janthinobacterium sp. 67]|nr:hypothetical protein CLU90_4004 [Janthinobacterium sp. 67]